MTLSYNHLYDYVRRERSHQELQELPIDFYTELQLFFRELSLQLAADPLSAKGESARIQLVNGKKLFKQLYEAREQKILHLAQTRCRTGSSLVDTSKLLTQEKDLFERALMELQHARNMIGLEDMEPPVPRVEPEVIERVTIRVLKAVPQFLDATMETYGPFDENATVELPAPIAQVLIRKGTAQQE